MSKSFTSVFAILVTMSSSIDQTMLAQERPAMVFGELTESDLAVESQQVESQQRTDNAAASLETPAFEFESRKNYPLKTTTDTSSASSLFQEFTAQLAFDGSKQPQDFGVNANSGLQGSMNWGLPLLADRGIGFQVGTNVTSTSNAVQVYELLGEATSRFQNFTTIGAFQRLENGLAWGGVYDFLYQDSFDHFSLGQWRVRGSWSLNRCNELGLTAQLRSQSASGTFGAATPVTLRSINQVSLYWRRFWPTGAQSTLWAGIADRHGEDNAVTGPGAVKHDSLLFGADVLMPLNRSFAIYGETNMITPFDTGTVDAFLGVQWYPGRNSMGARRGKFAPLLPTASPVSFSTDLLGN